jgi:hypothetical protein
MSNNLKMSYCHIRMPPLSDLLAIIRFRLFLRVFYVSNIVDGTGQYISDSACQGKRDLTSLQMDCWPDQGNPSHADLDTWHCFLRTNILGRGLRLRTPLGDWTTVDPEWQWFFDPLDQSLIHKQNTTYHKLSMIP